MKAYRYKRRTGKIAKRKGVILGKIYFILGGARSGKSSYGELLASELSGKVAYIATSKITDCEMHERVEKHRKRRPETWITYELKDSLEFCEIEQIFDEISSSSTGVILIDCLTNLLFRVIDRMGLNEAGSNENTMDSGDTISRDKEARIEKEVFVFFDRLIDKICSLNANVIIVSNELGMGVVPASPLGRIFRDLMGVVNKKVAEKSDEVYFFIAGLKQRLK